MKPPIYVRSLDETEQEVVAAGLRAAGAFTRRRCQIVRASAAGRQVPQVAHALGGNEQTVRNAIHTFTDRGTAALTKGSSRAHTIHAAFTPQTAERLRRGRRCGRRWCGWGYASCGPKPGLPVPTRRPPEKRQRDQLPRLSAAHPAWLLGFADEVGWSRLTAPPLHAWAGED